MGLKIATGVLALAEFDCTILVDDDNKKYLLDSVNAAIYFRASVLNHRRRSIFERDTVGKRSWISRPRSRSVGSPGSSSISGRGYGIAHNLEGGTGCVPIGFSASIEGGLMFRDRVRL